MTLTHRYAGPLGSMALRKLDDGNQFRVIAHEPSDLFRRTFPVLESYTGWIITVVDDCLTLVEGTVLTRLESYERFADRYETERPLAFNPADIIREACQDLRASIEQQERDAARADKTSADCSALIQEREYLRIALRETSESVRDLLYYARAAAAYARDDKPDSTTDTRASIASAERAVLVAKTALATT